MLGILFVLAANLNCCKTENAKKANKSPKTATKNQLSFLLALLLWPRCDTRNPRRYLKSPQIYHDGEDNDCDSRRQRCWQPLKWPRVRRDGLHCTVVKRTHLRCSPHCTAMPFVLCGTVHGCETVMMLWALTRNQASRKMFEVWIH